MEKRHLGTDVRPPSCQLRFLRFLPQAGALQDRPCAHLIPRGASGAGLLSTAALLLLPISWQIFRVRLHFRLTGRRK